MTLDPSRMKKGGLLVVPLIVAGLVGHGCARKTDAMYGIYRVFHQLADLVWVNFDLGNWAVCLILLGQKGFRQNQMSIRARCWKNSNLSQPNPGPQADGTPCISLLYLFLEL